MNETTDFFKKGIALLLSFTIFFESITPAWATPGKSDEEEASLQPPPRKIAFSRKKEEDKSQENSNINLMYGPAG